MTGTVFLVGAGPGDPGLITLKGVECIKKADVVIYDYLAAPHLLNYASDAAEILYVGKKGGDHTLSQDGINALIVEKALAGKTVARLKGGDPFVFGRGGEEAEVLAEQGIPFEIVPGVTSAVAAPAYAGIPLTHREHTPTVAFVTGHEDPTKAKSGIDWEAISRGIGTLVFFMGVKNLPRIVAKLIENGKAPDTPVALVRWGTTSRQTSAEGTLDTIVEVVRVAGLKAPAIIIVGNVVKLRKTLRWFEDCRPLLGKRIVVTRARQQASGLVHRLSELGADCLECPTISIGPPRSWTALDRTIENLSDYNWLVFTSVNGVRFFFQRLFAAGKDVRALGHLKTAVIGPATREKLAGFGLSSDIVPETYRAESVVDAFSGKAISGSRILLPRAAVARPVLPDQLTAMGATVDEVVAYETAVASGSGEQLLEHLESGGVDMVTFTSSSTVKNFKALLPEEKIRELTDGVTMASIGPITTDTAESLGFSIHVKAGSYTIPGLCEAIVSHYRELDNSDSDV